jgi:DNA-binding NtrC family response regulator
VQADFEGSDGRVDYNLQFSNCEYHCSMVVESYRPDYVVIDCLMGTHRSREFARNLAEDPRIPYVRVILAGERDRFPKECDREVLAYIEHPFGPSQLTELIDGLQEGGTENLGGEDTSESPRSESRRIAQEA